MCGIGGVIVKPGHAKEPSQFSERLINSIRFRGPDGQGSYSDERVCLVHARLSIIDLSLGQQPMADQSKETILTYNGEIFNFKELRRQLQLDFDYQFRTNSDTEVFLAAYKCWGPSFLEKLDGEFAAAIYDKKKSEIHFFRDRFGIRPLFYRTTPNLMVFGSTIFSLKAAGPLEFDDQNLQFQFLTWAPPPGQTPYRDCFEIRPGHWATLNLKSWNFSESRYWEIPHHENESDGSERAAEEFREALDAAIETRTVADVEVGAYLSGGVDSSYICARLSKAAVKQGKKLNTFSIEFADPRFDESQHQRALASQLDTIHRPLRISDHDLVSAISDATFQSEIPSFRLAYVPMYLLSKHVRQQGLKCVLTGEGADELLFGYEIFKEYKIRSMSKGVDPLRSRLTLLGKVYPYLEAFQPRFLRATLGSYQAHEAFLNLPAGSHSLRWDSFQLLNSVFLEPRWSSLTKAMPDISVSLTKDKLAGLDQVQSLEVQTLLSGYLLSTQGDRMAMANAVEARPVFLSHKLWEKMAKYKPAVFLRGLHEKRPLRRAARDILPESFARRPKNPYRSPDAASFFRAKPDNLMDLITEERLKQLPMINARRASQFLETLKNRPPESISQKQNSAFVFLLTCAVLHDKMRSVG